jgi:hypothetical protein
VQTVASLSIRNQILEVTPLGRPRPLLLLRHADPPARRPPR